MGTDSPAWSTQQLAEFIAAVSAVGTQAAAARAAVERAAEAFDADVAAIVCGGGVIAAVGYPEGGVPVGEFAALQARPDAGLTVPGTGRCAAASAALDYPPGATLVLARPDVFNPEETGLLRGMARVAAITMRMLSVLDYERGARAENERLARQQAALRRVAMLVARGAPPRTVFEAVAEEVGHVLPEADFTLISRYDPDRAVEVVGAWSRFGPQEFVGMRTPVGGRNVSTFVFERNEPARVDDLGKGAGAVATAARALGMRSAAGAPISVEGRVWGVMVVASARENALPAGTEHRLAAFTELIATTVSNAEARQELSALADQQAALRRVAMLVARGAPPRTVFEAVAEEAGRLLPADLTLIGRFEDGLVSGVAGWSMSGEDVPIRSKVSLGGRNVTDIVYHTGRPARLDTYADASGAVGADARGRGIGSAVGAPIIVEGLLWGVMIAASTHGEPLPRSTEERLADFTELVATAIANAEARAELRRVADEQAALRRVATLVAHGAAPPAVFEAVTEEIGRLLPADITVLYRYDPGGQLTRVGAWSRTGQPLPAMDHAPLGGRNVTTLVFQTGRAARVDRYDDDPGPSAVVWIAEAGLRSSVGAPVSVEGRLWGVVVASATSDQTLPDDTESRLAGFTELIATAIANAEAQAELTASRARIVATADETRRRIERDLHDGAQQRLVSTALQLRAAQAAVPAELEQLGTELDRVATALTSTLDELREYARGIHPAILAEGGLVPALKTLARRSSVPVVLDLDVRTGTRLPERVEVTAYYVVSEALTNAAKHATASVVHVDVHAAAGVLRLAVRDDGAGGADPALGSGLVGLKDRVEAIGGAFTVHSPPGQGTRLAAELPAPASG